jgi:YrbI family 3-deoxy-D-manno-octulosonate 8-phosphate phosphatase
MVTARKPEVLAIIPARGGSKGIPRKNIRKFAGYPLIAYSIEAGRSAQCVTRVIVSTDDEEIAAVARAFGAEAPFLRPDELAQDKSLDLPVFEHALRWLAEQEGYHPEVVVQLRPTSPVRPPALVDDAVHLLLEHPEASSVRGVVPAGQNPHKMWRVGKTGERSEPMRPLLEVEGIAEPYNAPRQVLPPVYWQTGHIDAIRPRVILEEGSMSGKTILPLMIDPRYTVDIDNLWDWQRYEWLVWHGGLEMVTPGRHRRPFPEDVRLVVFDFDGVMTDNRVWVDASGRELISANRSDSLGIKYLRDAGIESLVISREMDPVVTARCNKMKVSAIQGVLEKGAVLRQVLADRHLDPRQVVYVGNDTIDIPCFEIAGWGVAVQDSHPEVLRAADFILSLPGGFGAVRELCDLILNRLKQRS